MTEVAEVKTIGDVERIVHGSGFWDGTDPVEFSDDGEFWTEAWAPSKASEQGPVLFGAPKQDRDHPAFARVTVYRKDVRIGTRVTIRWDEQRPRENEEWAAKWDAAPTRHFGRTARMVAFRQTFRDILGDVSIEDEERATPTAPPAPVERDWRAEFEATTDVDALDAIVREARTARVFTPTPEGTSLDIAWKTHRKALLVDWTPAKDAWEPAEQLEVGAGSLGSGHSPSVETAAQREGSGGSVEDPSTHLIHEPAPARRAPQDHLPGNRAQRRGKKRGRR